ncbi:GntR family transcriptional regulator [Comamonas sp. GB3 AK4-5]|uniref:GntR family transcriptional regulator n=1 Tax=Comamonas sp. GB3 AK4-5 TaxID=3231487 RepID=UPI00351DCDED
MQQMGQTTNSSSSLRERIRAYIEECLRTGLWTLDQTIDEQAIASHFGSSRTPVREALLTLESMGVVAIVPRSGTRVRRLETRELVAMMEALGEYEGIVARLASLRVQAKEGEQLRAALERTEHYAQMLDSDGYEKQNRVLHDLIYQICRNPYIVEHTRLIRLRIAPYRGQMFASPARLRESQQEHAQVVGHILEGRPDAAAEAMRNHISMGGKVFANLLLV